MVCRGGERTEVYKDGQVIDWKGFPIDVEVSELADANGIRAGL